MGLVECTIDSAPDEVFDVVILFSVVHHIPDRDALFREIRRRLKPGGRILAVDPTHYILRWRKVLRKILTRGHLSHQVDLVRRREFSTHAMCQLAEYRAIARAVGLRVVRAEFFDQPRRVRSLRSRIPLGLLWRWLSQEMLVELVRDE